MLLKDQVIVIGIIPYKEKNLILKTYSKNSGIQSFFVSRPAVSKSKSRSKNNYQLFSILEVIYRQDGKTNLPRIKEHKHLHVLLSVQTEVTKGTMVFLLCEILLKSIKEEEANPNLYEFILHQILNLENCPVNFANLHLHFIAQLTLHLGIAPAPGIEQTYFDLEEGLFCDLIPKHPHYLNQKDTQLLQYLLYKDWDEIRKLKLNGERRSNFLMELLKYYQYHIPGFELPKSLSILNEMFNN